MAAFVAMSLHGTFNSEADHSVYLNWIYESATQQKGKVQRFPAEEGKNYNFTGRWTET